MLQFGLKIIVCANFLIQIQKKGAFQPKEEEKLLLAYRKSARRPSSFF